MEAESGVGEEADHQGVAVADSLDAVLGLVGDPGDGVAGAVGELAALEVGPQVFDRVELGCIGGRRSTVSQWRWASRWARSLSLQWADNPSHNSTTGGPHHALRRSR
jgi:hypothetical protein